MIDVIEAKFCIVSALLKRLFISTNFDEFAALKISYQSLIIFFVYFSGIDGQGDLTQLSPATKRPCYGQFAHAYNPAVTIDENTHPVLANLDFFQSPHKSPHGNMSLEVRDPFALPPQDISEDNGMDLEPSLVHTDRFARFPSNKSPTYWHKSNAIAGVADILSASACHPDDFHVRTWECGYMGRSDIY